MNSNLSTSFTFGNEPRILYNGLHTSKMLGYFPVASGVEGQSSYLGGERAERKIIRFGSDIYCAFKHSVMKLDKRTKIWQPFYRFLNARTPSNNAKYGIIGPYYHLKNNRPAFSLIYSNNASRSTFVTFDGSSFEEQILDTTLVSDAAQEWIDVYNFKTLMINNQIGAFSTAGGGEIRTTFYDVVSSGAFDFIDASASYPSLVGHASTNWNDQILTLGYYNAVGWYFPTFDNNNTVLVAFPDGSAPANSIQRVMPGAFKAVGSDDAFFMYYTSASGLRIKKISSIPTNLFYIYNLENRIGHLNSQGNLFRSYGTLNYLNMAIQNYKVRNNPDDLSSCNEIVMFDCGNGNQDNAGSFYSSYLFNLANESGFNILNAIGPYNRHSSVPANHYGDGSLEYNGHEAYIQLEGVDAGSGNDNCSIYFRLYTSNTMPSGTPAIVSFLYARRNLVPNRTLRLTNPSHNGIISDGVYIRNIQFDDSIRYRVDIDGFANNLSNEDVLTIIPVVSGVL